MRQRLKKSGGGTPQPSFRRPSSTSDFSRTIPPNRHNDSIEFTLHRFRPDLAFRRHDYASLVHFASCFGLCQAPVLDTSTQTRTPIKHFVVIFDENISVGHCFGTYRFAPNPPGEPKFLAKPGTPAVNGFTAKLLVDDPNLPIPFICIRCGLRCWIAVRSRCQLTCPGRRWPTSAPWSLR